MVPEEGPDGPGAGQGGEPPRAASGVREAWLQRQISRELRMRAGAENLYRATSNARVRQRAALELSAVNCALQLLREELQELGSAEDAPPGPSAGSAAPMIPLGLKETKELDWSAALRELISGHFGEDGAAYAAEIQALADLRQAARTPSRSARGLGLLAAYYSQLSFLDARFAAPGRGLGLLFQWYDSLTGLPAQQQALAFERGSVLFNLGALHSQIAARQDRARPEGARRAARAFQQAAGAFGLLRANFSHAPSADMSPAWLAMLEQLMTAQAQECVFEGLSLPGPAGAQDGAAQLHLAQEAAQVAADYGRVHGALTQRPVCELAPFSWAALAHVKAEHFAALAHFHAAAALCDEGGVAESELQQAFLGAPGPPLPREPEERRRLGKAHLRRAVLGQEEARRLHAACRPLRSVDPLQAVLGRALRSALARHAELDREDDFAEAPEARDIRPLTRRRPQARAPSFPQAEAADIFHRLGPLPVFSAKHRWRLRGPVRLAPGDGGFGFTLRGDAPVLVAAVAPGGRAAAAGLQRGDYIVALDGEPCRWWRHAEVVARLRAAGTEGVSLQAATPLPAAQPPSLGDRDRLAKAAGERGRAAPVPKAAGLRLLLGRGHQSGARPALTPNAAGGEGAAQPGGTPAAR